MPPNKPIRPSIRAIRATKDKNKILPPSKLPRQRDNIIHLPLGKVHDPLPIPFPGHRHRDMALQLPLFVAVRLPLAIDPRANLPPPEIKEREANANLAGLYCAHVVDRGDHERAVSELCQYYGESVA